MIRDEKHINQVLGPIQKLWLEHPALRFGEVVELAAREAHKDLGVQYIEDQDIVEASVRVLRRKRNPGAYFS